MPAHTGTPPGPRRNVAVGVIRWGRRVLVVQRPWGGPLGGLWEFPGGKVEGGETPEGALRRELYEETGLAVGPCMPLPTLRHDYPHVRVRLLPLAADAATPVVRLRGPVASRWVTPVQLARLPFLSGSAALIRSVRFTVR